MTTVVAGGQAYAVGGAVHGVVLPEGGSHRGPGEQDALCAGRDSPPGGIGMWQRRTACRKWWASTLVDVTAGGNALSSAGSVALQQGRSCAGHKWRGARHGCSDIAVAGTPDTLIMVWPRRLPPGGRPRDAVQSGRDGAAAVRGWVRGGGGANWCVGGSTGRPEMAGLPRRMRRRLASGVDWR